MDHALTVDEISLERFNTLCRAASIPPVDTGTALHNRTRYSKVFVVVRSPQIEYDGLSSLAEVVDHDRGLDGTAATLQMMWFPGERPDYKAYLQTTRKRDAYLQQLSKQEHTYGELIVGFSYADQQRKTSYEHANPRMNTFRFRKDSGIWKSVGLRIVEPEQFQFSGVEAPDYRSQVYGIWGL